MSYIHSWHLYAFEELESTNDEAKKEYIQNSKENIIIIADKQTNGRGRRGRVWLAPAGNLFMSLVFDFDIKNLGYLSIVSSLSLFETIKNIEPNLDVKIKWPNDVLVDMKKISGILIEKSDYENRFTIGIGVNIKASPKDLSSNYEATSLNELGVKIEREDFVAKFLVFFDKNIEKIKEDKKEELREKWQKNAINLNKNIAIALDNETIEGQFVGIDENCALLIKMKKNQIRKIYAGDVYTI